jgi:homotetrameric NADPH-dependent glutamate synthase
LTIADFRRRGTVTLIQALGRSTREMLGNYAEGTGSSTRRAWDASHIDDRGTWCWWAAGWGAPIFLSAGVQGQPPGDQHHRLSQQALSSGALPDQRQRSSAPTTAMGAGLVTGAVADMITTSPFEARDRHADDARRGRGNAPGGRSSELNTIMVDGTGMCGSCRVRVDGEVRFACVDGPDFDAHQIDFAELNARQRRFKVQETLANADFEQVCSLEKTLIIDGKRTYKKYSAVTPHQAKMPERNAHERAANFKEVNLGYSWADALYEAERCVQCHKPPCIAGCPVSIDIPKFIRQLIVRDLDGALETINESSIFPAVCGRVCPQERQCEAQCIIIKKKLEPVAIGRLERFVGDHGQGRPAKLQAAAGSLGKVAVIGSGPGGLAAAADLARHGAEVTVFEALHVVGGVLRYGIPAFRLPRDILDKEVRRLGEMGVRFELNKIIGKTFTVAQLMQDKGFAAVFVAAGAGAPTFLGIAGENAGQVLSANEFLTRVNLMGGDQFPYQGTPVGMSRHVVVIGGGNTAMDCLRVAKRLGADSVRCVYRRTEAEAPARIEELRHAREEGVEFCFLHAPEEILLDAQGDVRGLRARLMQLGEPDARGRRKPEATDAVVDLACDTVIYALGTKANPIIGRATGGLALDPRGYIAADEATQATNLPGVFAGGDIAPAAPP